MRFTRKRSQMVVMAICALIGVPLFAQQPATNAPAPVVQLPPMPAAADPSFEVATIKPTGNSTGFYLSRIQGESYAAHNVSLNDLVKYAYRMHSSQIVGMPSWATQDRYDIAATMQPEGKPTSDQARTMLKKLLADRFKLTVHNDTRTLPVFLLTVDKNGPKMKPSDGTTGDTEREVHGGIQLVLKGGTTKSYADFLQEILLDRPVIDQANLPGKYDFDVTFLPDNSMFGGRTRFPPDDGTSAPSLFTAIQALGLKLTSDKAPVDAIIIDHAEMPSAN